MAPFAQRFTRNPRRLSTEVLPSCALPSLILPLTSSGLLQWPCEPSPCPRTPGQIPPARSAPLLPPS
eukprot:74939-Prorocentrum_lima.AAC.1